MIKKKTENSLGFFNGINTFVGDSTILRGDFEVNGPLRIDGKFKGTIISNSMVYIGKKSISECVILAKSATIGGTIKGDIYAENSLIVLKSAEIIGNIYTTSINMDDGVVFDGKCQILTKDQIRELMDKIKKQIS
ncbi:MAG: polymer-forming cytoskeletal protein [Spirochaetales bacterium]|nr:polymer-forming cytoskeletal protein [Spirochaetales bacterium]